MCAIPNPLTLQRKIKGLTYDITNQADSTYQSVATV